MIHDSCGATRDQMYDFIAKMFSGREDLYRPPPEGEDAWDSILSTLEKKAEPLNMNDSFDFIGEDMLRDEDLVDLGDEEEIMRGF